MAVLGGAATAVFARWCWPCIPAVVELDLEVSDGKGAQDLAHHAQYLGVRHHEPCSEKKQKKQWDPHVVHVVSLA